MESDNRMGKLDVETSRLDKIRDSMVYDEKQMYVYAISFTNDVLSWKKIEIHCRTLFLCNCIKVASVCIDSDAPVIFILSVKNVASVFMPSCPHVTIFVNISCFFKGHDECGLTIIIVFFGIFCNQR